MKNKLVTPIIAMLLIVFMGSCEKDLNSSLSPKLPSEEKLASLEPLTNRNLEVAALKGINLGVAGNFAILSKNRNYQCL